MAGETMRGQVRFPEPPEADLPTVYTEETDRPLPAKVDARTRYAYFKTIARGGKSIIQSCKDLHLGRTICHKSLRSELKDHPIEQQRFLREARVTAMLQHPGTVPVYDIGRDGHGRLYFTMKLVHGYTMRELLEPEYRDRYDLRQLVNVVSQVGRALAYAHSHGVAHRDVKPENILVGPYGEILLLDWGLAKVWDREGLSEEPPESKSLVQSDDLSITRQGKLEGTVTYMSPEQIRRDAEIDGRTDVFSLGAVLFEILTGRSAATGDTVDKVIESVLHGNPGKPSELARLPVPERLEDICLRCLRKDPAERTQRADEMVRELEDWSQ